jgi:DNA-binding response OmpR family regulator
MKPLVLIAASMAEISPLAKILTKRFEIAIALNGEKAVFAARQRKPDVILIDENIRLADGSAVCPVLRHDHLETQEIPILFLVSDSSHQVMARQQGAMDYLHKPFVDEEVISRVHTFVSLSQMQQAQKRYSDSLEQKVKGNYSPPNLFCQPKPSEWQSKG